MHAVGLVKVLGCDYSTQYLSRGCIIDLVLHILMPHVAEIAYSSFPALGIKARSRLAVGTTNALWTILPSLFDRLLFTLEKPF